MEKQLYEALAALSEMVKSGKMDMMVWAQVQMLLATYEAVSCEP